MSPRAFYASFMVLALAVFLVTRHFLPKPSGLGNQPWWKRAALGLSAFVGGALGAKLPFALGDPSGWLTGAAWFSDGKTITCGLAGAYVAVELAKWGLGIHGKTGDSFALPLALAMAVGRWGCFFNGCCYGSATDLPWGVYFRLEGGWVKCHPTQIYESLFHLTMALILWRLTIRDELRTHRLQFYLIGYGVFRFLTEYVRPEPAWWLGWTFYQWAALALATALALQWAFEARKDSPR